MKKCLLLVVVVVLSTVGLSSEGKRVIVVQPFTTATGVQLPYDMKSMQSQLVAELNVELKQEFTVVGEAPAQADGSLYTLGGEFTAWHPGNAAKRMIIGVGSGRESSDIQYHVTDSTGQKVVDKKDTIRTNFYSQGQGSNGTLAHPIAQKIAQSIKDAKLK